ncbi:aromatic acid exporter family protein [Streptomyces sp. BBFR2]|uniref:FUSC family protein n=1 Tax=Streptomyces sp. BBFR2 TaxID=3372854 RepID=UPI0037D9E600
MSAGRPGPPPSGAHPGARRTGARDRIEAAAWPVLQQTAAVTASWVVATHLISHHQPFFAPIATVVALNASRGERGSNAVRLLVGVVVGILAGEAALLLLGHGAAALTVATCVALVAALALSDERIVLAQAAASAILTVATGVRGSGINRLTDALIGAGVALLVSQVLFPAEPIALLRRAETAVLHTLADALRHTADALTRGDTRSARRAARLLTDAHEPLAEVARMREAGHHAARRTVRWWGRTDDIAREVAYAGELAPLTHSCLALIRVAADTPAARRGPVIRAVAAFADAVATLAAAPGDHATRRGAAEEARAAVRDLTRDEAGAPYPERSVTGAAARAAATDLMRFAGVAPEQCRDTAFAPGAAPLDLPAPPLAPRGLPGLPPRRGRR